MKFAILLCLSLHFQTPKQQEKLLLPQHSIREWKAASHNQKLALCIGFATYSNKNLGTNLSAMDFYNCIDNATARSRQADGLRIADVAELCRKEMIRK